MSSRENKKTVEFVADDLGIVFNEKEIQDIKIRVEQGFNFTDYNNFIDEEVRTKRNEKERKQNGKRKRSSRN